MKVRFWLCILLSCFRLIAEENSLFFSDEDPTIFHHVHVLSGQLTLSFEDAHLEGAYPLSIQRSYGSYGALERNRQDSDLVLRSLRGGWMMQGGWKFLPHTNLLVLSREGSFSQMEFVASEPDGTALVYKYVRKEEINEHVYYYYYKPSRAKGAHSGTLSARNNPDNNILRVYVDKRGRENFDLSIFLPNGGERHYEKLSQKTDKSFGRFYYKLVWEILPSQHRVIYSYDKKDRLTLIDLKNPSMDKTLSWIAFDCIKTKPPYRLKMSTSDNHSVIYQDMESGGREYLEEVQKDSCKKERFSYNKGAKEMGCRVSEIILDHNLEAKVHYYDSSKHYWLRDEEFHKKHPEVDRVRKLEAPIGPGGEMRTLAEFFYHPKKTDVIDAEGALTTYHYKKNRILQIDQFHKGGSKYCSLKFLWKDLRLIAKILCDGEDRPLFSRTFSYDSLGNVLEEVLWGQITGHATGTFAIQEDGSLSGAECIRKSYKRYDPVCNVILEEEEGDLTYRYTYKQGTDLLTSKITSHKDRILKREFFLYNPDHLLIEEIIDDGVGHDVYDLNGIAQRTIKRYERSDKGFVTKCSQFFLSIPSFSEELLERHIYGYDVHNLLCKDEVYGRRGEHLYTLHFTYNERGQVLSKTEPLGGTSFYQYNERGLLVRSKEVGLPTKEFTYDTLGRVLISKEIDKEGRVLTSYSSYDLKGNIEFKMDPYGRITYQHYDSFKHPVETVLPTIKDEEGRVAPPYLHFTYDAANNLVSYRGPRGEVTNTRYNAFQNPILIEHPDGTFIRHFYYLNGCLEKTIQQDGSQIYYTYDPFLRKTSEKIYSERGALLSEEYWSYNTFHLLSHTDSHGLVTTYSYDGSGQKVRETAQDRTISYTYDSLGFLEKTTRGEISFVEIHDVEGKVVERFEQKGSLVENHTRFFYSTEGLLERAERVTSQGIATDLFFYDAEGRLCKHIDPLGATSQFLHYYLQDDIGQQVLCKVSVDPLGNKILETYDAAGRIASKEKQDPQGGTVSLEEVLYDLSGNKAKQVFTVYHGNTPLKKISHSFSYDLMGRLQHEVEAGTKRTSYSYDAKGRVATRTLPSQTTLFYAYDALDRLLALQSSDGSISYEYVYDRGKKPIKAIDHIHHRSFDRQYNAFEELTEERGLLATYHWEYDSLGRCIAFTLPDRSSISYSYQDGHLSSVSRQEPSGFPLYSHHYTQFDPSGHVCEEEMIFSLGKIQTMHDLLERPIAQSSSYLSQSLSYDPAGRVNNLKNSFFGEKALSYDALGQITQEGHTRYSFDSMGNNTSHSVNDCNQVLSSSDSTLSYDKDGNLLCRTLLDQTIAYSYDALGRLTSITYPEKEVKYSYDPFSRLFSKETRSLQKEEILFFLYDQEKEIGTMSSSLEIKELKVSGLGIRGDVGAAIAIELDHIPYAPLHDFRGNCIALFSSQGNLVESYELEAFGKEKASSPPINPWRFSSKRHEEGLVFFGQRFYDLFLERWLTPDPSGFSDGPNLYVYVLNSPHNRLDLFGLASQDMIQAQLVVQINQIKAALDSNQSLVLAKLVRYGVETDYCIFYGHWHKIQFDANEKLAGKINLFDHYVDVLPKQGDSVGMLSYENGIRTSFNELIERVGSIYNRVSEGTMSIGMYNPCKNLYSSLRQVSRERKDKGSAVIDTTSAFMEAHLDAIHKVNPDVTWAAFFHSEAGLIGRRAIEKLTQEGKEKMKQHAYILALGPAMPIPLEYAKEVQNTYSKKDFITKWYAYPKDGFEYNVRLVKCISPIREKVGFVADHNFMGSTYQQETGQFIGDLQKSKGFYHAQNR